MTFNNFFKHKFCINLDIRTDRWVKSQQEFIKHNINVERFSAVEKNENDKQKNNPIWPGQHACLKSHIQIIEMAKRNKWKNVFIFEDDVKFLRDDFNDIFEKNINHLPNDWEMLYLGGNYWSKPTKHHKENLYILPLAYMAHAYGVNSCAYDKILKLAEDMDKPIDVYYVELHKDNKCYTFVVDDKPLAMQRSSHSDIIGGFVNYNN